MFAYHGKTLTIDLTSQKTTVNTFDEAFARKYIGGNGFIAKYIYDNVPSSVKPFDKENVVGFASGPLGFSPLWGSGRGQLGGISPQTGYFADSNYGGDFANKLKSTGFDAIYITGESKDQVYITVIDGKVEFHDATDLWGLHVTETHEKVKELKGKTLEGAIIGPAGENKVLYASIMCTGKRVSAAGRCGLGAVLGSKKLKGLFVDGSQKTQMAQGDELKDFLKEYKPTMKENTGFFTDIGTPILVNKINSMGMLCTRNNTRETWDDAHKISGEVIKNEHKVRNIACSACGVACGKLVAVPTGDFAGQNVKMPEYETLYSIGTMLENSDIISIFNANALCDELGLDTISMGVTVSFMAECFEKGLVKEADYGMSIYFNDPDSLITAIKKTAAREGIGELLAQGSERIAKKIKQGSEKFLYSVKGLEIAGHSARGLKSMSLAYATSTRGGSHHDARAKYLLPGETSTFEEQPRYAHHSQNYTALGDSLVHCRFIMERGLGNTLNKTHTKIINMVTGWDSTVEEMDDAGDRIYCLERLINCDRGMGRKDDTLPWRVMNEEIPEGPHKGSRCSNEILQSMLDEFYKIRGWDEIGVPTEERLKKLGLK